MPAALTFNFPAGLLQWTGGSFFANSLTNTGTITLAGAADKGFGNTINNSGSILQTGTGNLVASGYAIFNNQANGVYDFRSDSQFYGVVTLNNSGILSKSAGNGVSEIGTPDPVSGNSYFSFNNNDGTIDVQSGTINVAAGGGLSNGGIFNASAGADLQFTGNLGFAGAFTGAGAGKVEFAGGSLTLVDTGAGGSSTTFDFPAGFFHWTGGQFNGGENTTPLTNLGFMTLDGANTKSIYRNTIINQGTIIDAGPGDLVLNGIGDFGGSTLDNELGATFDFQGDSNIVQSQANPGIFINSGTLEKTAGTGISNITENVDSTPSGLIDVQTGQLTLNNGGTFTGGSFNLASGTVLDFSSGPSFGAIFTMTGTYTGSGLGIDRFRRRFIRRRRFEPGLLEFRPGLFQHVGQLGRHYRE